MILSRRRGIRELMVHVVGKNRGRVGYRRVSETLVLFTRWASVSTPAVYGLRFKYCEIKS